MKNALGITATLVATLGLAPAAHAADLWTGYYAGATLGYGQHESSFTDTDYTYSGGTLRTSKDGLLIGLNGGFDKQFGSLVVGGQLDWTFGTFDDSYRYSNDADVENKLSWIATLRGRAGLALDDNLLYAVIGLALTDAEHSFDFNSTEDFSGDNDNIGFVTGLGVEHRFANKWGVRGELLAVNIPDQGIENLQGDEWKVGETVTSINIGATYRF